MKTPIIQRLLNFAINYSIIIFIFIICATGFFAYFATKVEINPDVETLISDNDKINQYIKEYGDEEDDNDHLAITVTSDNLFDIENLQLLDSVIKKLEALRASNRSINPFNMITFEKNGPKLEIHIKRYFRKGR